MASRSAFVAGRSFIESAGVMAHLLDAQECLFGSHDESIGNNTEG
jgi:hypothetical protein